MLNVAIVASCWGSDHVDFTYVPRGIDNSAGRALPQMLMVNPLFGVIRALSRRSRTQNLARGLNIFNHLLAGQP
jgi:hypothetical protein